MMCCAQAVLVHQLSKKATQNPFRKNRGRVVQVGHGLPCVHAVASAAQEDPCTQPLWSSKGMET